MSLNVVRRLAVGVTGAALAAALGSFVHAQAVPVNNPPHAPTSILVFPQRDFVSTSGFLAGDLVTVEVFHANGALASAASTVIPQDDPATPEFDGIVEVNHPGGACWATVTPDIRPGDRVRTTARDAATNVVRAVDETTVANVVTRQPVSPAPGVVQIHGTAQDGSGAPIAIAQLEHRLVAPRDAFDLNGRRTLRATAAANDGALAYDPVGPANPNGINWTATYSGLDAADVTRALAAESRIMWLGNPAGTVEATIYEIGAGIVAGPSAPCAAPLEKLPPPPGSELIPPSDPTNVTASVSGSNTVSLRWNVSTDNVGVTSYGIYRNGTAIANVENPDASAPAPNFYDDINVPPGTYTYTVDAADAVGNRSNPVATTPAQISTTGQIAADFPLCAANAPDATCVSEPPAATPTQVQIIPFPARDFTSASGYTEDVASVTVQVIRNGFLISTANVIPVDDPTTVGFDGTVEVNHPGGGCWVGVTPDIRANDIVRQIAFAADGSIVRVDQTHVSNVVTERPLLITMPSTATSSDGVVQVHGTAMAADGSPIPLDQITQRLVAPRDRFDFNGRRTLRAGLGEDFVLAYDTTNNPAGTKWTATYSGLNENDVYRAVGGTTSGGRTFPGAESRILFLGLPTVVAPEITIYENSDATIAGPSAGACTAPLEPLDTTAPTTPGSPTATRATGSNTVHLAWTASTDDPYVYGYGIYRDGVRIHNVGAAVLSYDDVNVPAGDHTYAVDAVDSASPLKVNFPPIANDVNASDPILQGVAYGNRSGRTADVTVSQPDVVAPSVPANVVGSASPNLDVNHNIVSWTITVTWQPSTDNVGVTSYRVYPAGRAAVDVTTATFSETVAANNTNTPVVYSYAVDAADQAGNRSAQSAPVSISISQQADASKPTTPGGFTADTRDVYSGATAPAIGPRDVRLSWIASTDNVGVATYAIYRRAAASLTAPSAPEAFVKIVDVNGSTLSYVDRDVALGTYDYTVDAVDSAGNRSAQAAIAANVVTVNDPPTGSHAIMPFPQRDFVSSGGYALTEGPIAIEVIRNGKIWARSTPVDVVEDPATPGLGAAEVNHPGGGCWDPGNGGITPDLRAGDIVRFTNRFGQAEETTTANVYAERATDRDANGALLSSGVIEVHGTAQDALGNPLPLDQIENRLIASSATPFEFNGRRVLRALGDGTIAYDAVNPVTNPKGTHWTATYSGLSGADVDMALTAESRAVWLGRNPIALSELTFFETGDGIVGGPAGPQCVAPAEAGPAVVFGESGAINASFDPGALTIAFAGRNTGSAVTQTLTLTNVGTADPARAISGVLSVVSTGLQYGPADFTLSANTCTSATVALDGTCTVTVQFKPTAPGPRVGKLVFQDNANNSPVQVFALSGDGIDAQAPTVIAPAMTLVTNTAMNVAANSVSVNVSSTATDASGVASMRLEMSTDGGRTWAPVRTSAAGEIAATLTFNVVSTYQFRASATDTLGNASAPVASPAYHVSVTDDNSGTPRFSGSWSTQKGNAVSAGAYGNTVHEATAPQPGKTNTVTFTFTGTEVALLAAVGPDRGQVSVSVDGRAAQVVDLYAPSQQQATLVGSVSGLAAGTHTVTVNALASRNAASSSTRVGIDAFVVKF